MRFFPGDKVRIGYITPKTSLNIKGRDPSLKEGKVLAGPFHHGERMKWKGTKFINKSGNTVYIVEVEWDDLSIAEKYLFPPLPEEEQEKIKILSLDEAQERINKLLENL